MKELRKRIPSHAKKLSWTISLPDKLMKVRIITAKGSSKALIARCGALSLSKLSANTHSVLTISCSSSR